MNLAYSPVDSARDITRCFRVISLYRAAPSATITSKSAFAEFAGTPERKRLDELDTAVRAEMAKPMSERRLDPMIDGYAAILVRLDQVTKKALKDALVDGWLAVAPERLVRTHGVPKL